MSRFHDFATRNRRQDRAAIAESARLSRRDVQFHRPKPPEPTLLDTDVESIGDSTTLTTTDLEPPTAHGNANLVPATGAADAEGPGSSGFWQPTTLTQPSTRRHEEIYDQQRDSPVYGRRDELATGPAPDDRRGQNDRLLDEVSSLPDSSRDHSPSPHPPDNEETPKRAPRTVEQLGEPIQPQVLFETTPRHLERAAAAAPPLQSKDFRNPFTLTKRDENRAPAFVASQLGASTWSSGQPGASNGPPHPQVDPSTIDYDLQELRDMPYAKLAEEPFDVDPKQHDPNEDPISDMDMEPLLQRLRDLATSDERDEIKHEKRLALFAALPIEKHEQAGELILEQFSAVFKQLQDIRRRKRQTAVEFEEKIADREAVVRERQEALAQSTTWLRKQGEDVVRGPM